MIAVADEGMPSTQAEVLELMSPSQMRDLLASNARRLRLQQEELEELRPLRLERRVLQRSRLSGTESNTDALRVSIRTGVEILEHPTPARWLLRPYLEENALGLLYGDLGTLKSFLALDWALTLAADGKPSLYMSAEGRGLERRIRAWCLRRDPTTPPAKLVSFWPFSAIEQSFPLSQAEVLGDLEHAIDDLGTPPKLVILDTLNRFGGPLDENRAADIAQLVTAFDRLRHRYGSSVLLVHHTGHQAKDRARGSYALMAATDAHFLVERPDPSRRAIRVTTGRLKDSESPPPFELEADIVDLGDVDDDGQPRTSLVLRPTSEAIALPCRPPTGKRQAQLLRLLEADHSAGRQAWTDLDVRELARPLGIHRNSVRDAILGLRSAGYLVGSAGGMALKFPPGTA